MVTFKGGWNKLYYTQHTFLKYEKHLLLEVVCLPLGFVWEEGIEWNRNEWKELFYNILPFPYLEVLIKGIESLFSCLGV